MLGLNRSIDHAMAPSVHMYDLFEEPEMMLRLCERISPFSLYTSERVDHPIATGLAERHDVMAHFLKHGNRFGQLGTVKEMARRTNYFRGELAYATQKTDGIEAVLHHERIVAAAKLIHDAEIVVPNIVFANVVVPGQELAPHTDVPEFIGCNRKTMPQWLVVVMLRSGLFDAWRVKIATTVSWLTAGVGGAFACWPSGPDGDVIEVSPTPNSSFTIDNCNVVHAVDRFGPADAELALLRPGMTLDFAIDTKSIVTAPSGEEIARYSIDDLRVALVWKGYCFEDERALIRWQQQHEELTIDVVISRLVDDLRERGRIGRVVPQSPELGLLMIDEYVRYPSPSERCD